MKHKCFYCNGNLEEGPHLKGCVFYHPSKYNSMYTKKQKEIDSLKSQNRSLEKRLMIINRDNGIYNHQLKDSFSKQVKLLNKLSYSQDRLYKIKHGSFWKKLKLLFMGK